MTPSSNSSSGGTESVKFLYSYGGRIIPRPMDGELRYVGGHTRVLSVDRAVTFSELMVKFVESCGFSVDLRCKLPSEDMDVLISIKSDEDLENVIAEYDRVSPGAKIRAVLFPIKSAKKISPPSSPVSCFDFPSPKPLQRLTEFPPLTSYHAGPPCAAVYRCCSPAVKYQNGVGRQRYGGGVSPSNLQSVRYHNCSHCH
ncbi:RAF-like serine/threonine-protein kinase PRAF [Henckelia pumila]|uniref:RAF-like serine/threonine-protein kinase PRAF n=1 Tax=Henckelia pumila TaxID=405737 RepID=UPI003C6E8505